MTFCIKPEDNIQTLCLPKHILVAFIIISCCLFFVNLISAAEDPKLKSIISSADNYFSQQLYIPAIEKYNQVLKIDPKNAYAHYRVGIAYQALEDQEKAKAAYLEALKIDPNMSKALNNLAAIYLYNNELEEALKLAKKAIDANPGLPFSYGTCGAIYEKMGKYDLALEMFQKMAADQTYGKEARDSLERIQKIKENKGEKNVNNS